MRSSTIRISKSNVIDSLMPLLLSTGYVHDGEKVTDFHLESTPPGACVFILKIEKEN